MHTFFCVFLLSVALSAGCGSDGGSKPNTGGKCGDDLDVDNLKVTAVVKQTSSDPLCPNLTPEDINEDGAGDDAGADDCEPVVNEAACTVSIKCTDKEGTNIEGTFKVDGDSLKGTLKLMTSSPNAVSCAYDLTWM